MQVFSESEKPEMNKKAKAICKGMAVAGVLLSLFAPGQAKAGDADRIARWEAIQIKAYVKGMRDGTMKDLADNQESIVCKPSITKDLCFKVTGYRLDENKLVMLHEWFDSKNKAHQPWKQYIKMEKCDYSLDTKTEVCIDFDTKQINLYNYKDDESY